VEKRRIALNPRSRTALERGFGRVTDLHALEGIGLVERLSLLIGSIDAAGRLDAG
jgi:hypothetical protein